MLLWQWMKVMFQEKRMVMAFCIDAEACHVVVIQAVKTINKILLSWSVVILQGSLESRLAVPHSKLRIIVSNSTEPVSNRHYWSVKCWSAFFAHPEHILQYFIYFPCLGFSLGCPFVVVCLEISEFLISRVLPSDESYWTLAKSLVQARSDPGMQFLFKFGTRMAEMEHSNGKELVFKCYNNLGNFQCRKEELRAQENKALVWICRSRSNSFGVHFQGRRQAKSKENRESSAVFAAATRYRISLLCVWQRKPAFKQEPRLTLQQRPSLKQQFPLRE